MISCTVTSSDMDNSIGEEREPLSSSTNIIGLDGPRRRLLAHNKNDDVATITASLESVNVSNLTTITTTTEQTSLPKQHHDLFHAFGKASKHLIFNPNLYPKEKIHCSQPDIHKIPV